MKRFTKVYQMVTKVSIRADEVICQALISQSNEFFVEEDTYDVMIKLDGVNYEMVDGMKAFIQIQNQPIRQMYQVEDVILIEQTPI